MDREIFIFSSRSYVFIVLLEEYISFSDAYRSRQRKETAIGLIPLPGTHYYPVQPVLQMPRQLDCFQGDDTRLGFWQGRTNSHDGKTYNFNYNFDMSSAWYLAYL